MPPDIRLYAWMALGFADTQPMSRGQGSRSRPHTLMLPSTEVIMRRRATKGFAEVDTFTRWKHLLKYVQHAGVKSGIKRQARARERHQARSRIRRGEDD